MGVTIEELRFILSGDSKQAQKALQEFGEKLRETAEHPAKSIQGLAETITKDLGGSLTGAVGTVGLLTAGVVAAGAELNALAMAATHALANLNDLSEITSISVRELSALKYAAEVAGTTVENLANLVFMAQRRMQESPDEFNKGLKKIGLSIEAIKGLKPEEQFLAIAGAFRRNTDETNRAGVAIELFGRQGRDSIPLLMKPLDDLTQQAKKLGLTFQDEDAKAAEDFEMSLNALKAQAAATWTQLGLHVSIAGQLTYAYERMKLAIANVALTLSEVVGLLRDYGTLAGLLSKAGFGPVGPLPTAPGAPKPNLPTPLGMPGWATNPNLLALEEKKITDAAEEHLKKITKAARDAADALQKMLEAEDRLARGSTLGLFGGIIGGRNSVGVTPLEPPPGTDILRAREQLMLSTDYAAGLGLPLPARQFGGWAGLIYGDQRDHGNMATAVRPSAFRSGLQSMFGLDHESGGSRIGDMLRSQGVGAGLGLLSGLVNENSGKAVRGLGGAAKGAQIGMIAGPWGAAIGAGIGAIAGLLNNPEKKINPIREAFVQAAGGLDVLNRRAHDAGVTLDHLLDAKNPKQYQAAIDELNNALQFQDHAAQVLTDTIKKYGFSIEELGPAMQRQELDKQAQTLFQDWKVLTAAGLDVAVVGGKMADSVNEYFHMALKTGTEIPAAMRPMLQQFVDLGLLTDTAGNAVTDLGETGVTFAETMTEGFKHVVESVDKLTAAIARMLGLTNAAANAVANFPPFPDPAPYIPGAETNDIPSFDNRTMERVTRAGYALVHPGDVVGVPRPGQFGRGGLTVNVHVEGSVLSERDLVQVVTEAIMDDHALVRRSTLA